MIETTLNPTETVEDARAWLWDHVEEGVHCPVCTQLAKVYKRFVSSGAAQVLILMHKDGGDADGYVHVPSLEGAAAKGGEVARMRFFRLIEECPTRREDGGRRGLWRVTPFGREFLLGEETIARYADVYDNEVQRYHGGQVTITDALGRHFDYAALMRGDG